MSDDKKVSLLLYRKEDMVSPLMKDALDPLDPLASGHFYIIYAYGSIWGWHRSLTAADALRACFYDWQDPAYQAKQTGICRKSEIEEAKESGEILNKLRIRDPEISRLRSENARLRAELKARKPKPRKA